MYAFTEADGAPRRSLHVSLCFQGTMHVSLTVIEVEVQMERLQKTHPKKKRRSASNAPFLFALLDSSEMLVSPARPHDRLVEPCVCPWCCREVGFKREITKGPFTCMALVLLHCICDTIVNVPEGFQSFDVESLVRAGYSQSCHDKAIGHAVHNIKHV